MEAIAMFVGIGLAVGAVFVLALKALSESKGRREGEVRAAQAEARATSLSSQLVDTETQLKNAQEHQNDLEDLLDAWALDEPVDGAFERMLEKRKARRAAGGQGVGVVHSDDTAERVDPDRLLEPGE